jgi:hypothetical protein
MTQKEFWDNIKTEIYTNMLPSIAIDLLEKFGFVRISVVDTVAKRKLIKFENVESWLLQDISNFPYKLESLSWINDPLYYYNTLELVELNTKWYITTLQHQKWSNNVFMCKTSILKNVIDELQVYKNLDKYTGLEETLINKINLNVKIAGGDGLFTHLDYVKLS